jgi:hypothetical protein
MTPEGALEITLEYLEHHEIRVPEAGRPTLEVAYADLVQRPDEQVARIVDFLGIAASTETRGMAASLPTTSSLEAWREDPVFVSLGERFAPRLQRLGYEV